MTASAGPPAADPRPGWGQSLADGAAGIALAHIHRARHGGGSWRTAHLWAAAMTRAPVNAHPEHAGLFHGAPAVAYVLHTAGKPGYEPALVELDRHITDHIRARLDAAHDRIDRGHLPELREYDLISGLTGLAVYLLHRGGHEPLLRDVLTYLVRLTRPIRRDGIDLPGWWTGQSTAGRLSHDWPGGHANLGMAHGITGPLALLSTAMRHGTTTDGKPEAIHHIRTWLHQWHTGPDTAPWWPATVTPAEHRTGRSTATGPQRPSWCYGTPGVARALQTAAIALDDPAGQQHAERALLACVGDEHQTGQLADVTLCHGWAGLIQTVRRAAAEPGAVPALAEALPALAARASGSRPGSGEGLMEGAAGTALADEPLTTGGGWDACLLLTP